MPKDERIELRVPTATKLAWKAKADLACLSLAEMITQAVNQFDKSSITTNEVPDVTPTTPVQKTKKSAESDWKSTEKGFRDPSNRKRCKTCFRLKIDHPCRFCYEP